MEYPRSDNPGGGDMRRSVGEATERIHEIIDAAERVASEIRRDAEAEANRYLEERRRDADRTVDGRGAAFDQLTRTLADIAQEFKDRAEHLLSDLDRAVVDSRAGVYRQGGPAPISERPSPEPPAPRERDPLAPLTSGLDFGPSPSPAPAPARREDPFELPPLEPQPVTRIPEPEPEPRVREPEPPPPAPAPAPAAAPVAAYPGRGDAWREERPAADADMTSEALLRATQLAVTGKDRSEIAATLRADFPGVDAEPLLDEILG